MNTNELLLHAAALMSQFGPDSDQLVLFIQHHDHNTEFAELATFARQLKKSYSKGRTL